MIQGATHDPWPSLSPIAVALPASVGSSSLVKSFDAVEHAPPEQAVVGRVDARIDDGDRQSRRVRRRTVGVSDRPGVPGVFS